MWALLTLGGLIYDLERLVIIWLLPRVDMLPVMGLGLASHWEQRGDGLWLRDVYMPPKIERDAVRHAPYQRRLTLEQCRQARALVAAGKSLRAVAAHFGVSRMAIWRSIRGMDNPPAPEEGS